MFSFSFSAFLVWYLLSPVAYGGHYSVVASDLVRNTSLAFCSPLEHFTAALYQLLLIDHIWLTKSIQDLLTGHSYPHFTFGQSLTVFFAVLFDEHFLFFFIFLEAHFYGNDNPEDYASNDESQEQ
jgi:hypothetical protein